MCDSFGLLWIFGWQVGLGVDFRFWILDCRLKKSELAFMGVQGRSKVRVEGPRKELGAAGRNPG